MIKKELEKKLHALNISAAVIDVKENDFYLSFLLRLAPDVTISKLRARLEDLSIFLGGPVELDTSGGAVVLKLANSNRQKVGIYNYTCDISGGLAGYEIPLIIGQTENGTRLYYDLVKTPHLLAAGSTGSGKSVFMHNCILSALYSGKTTVVLIDVKRVEFSKYENIPHLAAPICYDTKTAFITLKGVVDNMNQRYELLQQSGARNIQEYRKNGGKMNYITVFIDEMADLFLSDKRIEKEVIKIAQLGRAAGIHLIVATQRPDSTIINGLIRANIPSRVCFAVQKATDSRIILDQSGGEKLRGAGDGLFLPIGSKEAIHFQAPFISTAALQKAVELARHCND